MKVTKDEIIAILGQFNPWWRGEQVPDIPAWRRAAYKELFEWITNPPAHRATLVSGARQVGKTTLLLQAIDDLLKKGVPAANILYATFDHPIFKLAGIELVLEAWRERETKQDGPEYIFIDEGQFVRDLGVWIKHQVDFVKHRRIIFTGSAMPLIEADLESGVGRWHTIRLATLSFYEYVQIKKLSLPELPEVGILQNIFSWPKQEFYRVAEIGKHYIGHFHEYLVRGGFPQTAQIESVTQAQRLLREDIIDKVLKRDMTALFGVRRVLELENTFLYLCMHDGGLLNMADLCANLSVKRPTAQHFIDLLKATHLIYRLPPYGYGKDILRARYKIYLADAAIAPAVFLKGKGMLDDPIALGVAVETAVFKHLYTHYKLQHVRLSYWRGKKNHEVDIVAEAPGEIIPFEVKYRSQHTETSDMKGLLELCRDKKPKYSYVITKSLDDFGLLDGADSSGASVMKIPATLFCYWLGQQDERAEME